MTGLKARITLREGDVEITVSSTYKDVSDLWRWMKDNLLKDLDEDKIPLYKPEVKN